MINESFQSLLTEMAGIAGNLTVRDMESLHKKSDCGREK
jgi:hypothetical protein